MIKLPPGRRNGDELITRCPNPICPNPEKFSYNVKEHIGNCFRCGFTIKGRTQAERVFGTALDAGSKPLPYRLAPPAEVNLVPVEGAEIERPRAYLTERRVSRELWGEIFYSAAEDMLYFPITAGSSHLKPSWTRRQVSGRGWYGLPNVDKANYFFNFQRWLQNVGAPPPGKWPVVSRPIILVEGPFDVLSPAGLCPTWANYAVSTLGSTVYKEQVHTLVKAGVTRVLVWYDPDDAGRHGALEAEVLFRKWGIRCDKFEWAAEPGDCQMLTPFHLALGMVGA